MSDEVIVRMLTTKQEAGLRALLDQHGQATRATLQKGLRGRDDLIDQAIVSAAHQVWERPDAIDMAAGSLGSYFYTIVRNAVRKLLRRESSERALLAQWNGSRSGSGELTEKQRELVADLRLAIAKLAPLQQAIIRADLEEGGSAPAAPIAEAFGTTANSIYVSRNKGYDRLRRLMQQGGHFLDGPPGDGAR